MASQIENLISVFEKVTGTLGVDPTSLIKVDKDVIIQCLKNQLVKNGIDMEDAENQAKQIVANGTDIVNDMQNKLKDAATGCTNAIQKIMTMPSEIATTVSQGVANLASVASNPFTINCLPSATLSFVQSINNVKTELTSTLSNAVNNLKILDDLGLTDATSQSVEEIENAITEINSTIEKGLENCPSGIMLDYSFTGNFASASSISFSDYQATLPSEIVNFLDVDKCKVRRVNDSTSTSANITNLALAYDTSKITDTLPVPKGSYKWWIPFNNPVISTCLDRKTSSTLTTYITGVNLSTTIALENIKQVEESTGKEVEYFDIRSESTTNFNIRVKTDIYLPDIVNKNVIITANGNRTYLVLSWNGTYITVKENYLKATAGWSKSLSITSKQSANFAHIFTKTSYDTDEFVSLDGKTKGVITRSTKDSSKWGAVDNTGKDYENVIETTYTNSTGNFTVPYSLPSDIGKFTFLGNSDDNSTEQDSFVRREELVKKSNYFNFGYYYLHINYDTEAERNNYMFVARATKGTQSKYYSIGNYFVGDFLNGSGAKVGSKDRDKFTSKIYTFTDSADQLSIVARTNWLIVCTDGSGPYVYTAYPVVTDFYIEPKVEITQIKKTYLMHGENQTDLMFYYDDEIGDLTVKVVT